MELTGCLLEWMFRGLRGGVLWTWRGLWYWTSRVLRWVLARVRLMLWLEIGNLGFECVLKGCWG